jgi:murein DD-endopeptidase MepM/ murein hydrolase activator NlpD
VTWLILLVSAVSLLVTSAAPASTGTGTAPDGTWRWPVEGPVIREFDPPDSPYGSGHRGIDIAAPVGTAIVAPADGTIVFAGPVGGALFLTIDHGGGVESTFSWLSALAVRPGDLVTAGQVIAVTGWGHPAEPVPHLHFGVKVDDVYVDPLAYLSPPSVAGFIRLAPLAT